MMIILLLALLQFCPVHSFSNSEYGPFNVLIKNSEFCKGPKRDNCITSTASKVNDTTLHYDLVVKNNISNIHGIIYAISSDTKQTVKFQFKNMCKHPFWEPLMNKIVTYKHCSIEKGHYHNFLNVQEIAQAYYGGSFIFGGWKFKTIMFNNDCNFVCYITDLQFTPKSKT